MHALIGGLFSGVAASSGVTALNVVSFAVSVAAVAVAAVAVVVSIKSNRKASTLQGEANDLQERLVAVEEGREQQRVDESQRAHLVGRLVRTPRTLPLFYLRIENLGLAKATRISVDVNGRPVSEEPSITGPLRAELGPNACHQYLIARDFQTPDLSHLHIEWDDAGGGGTWDSEVTFETMTV